MENNKISNNVNFGEKISDDQFVSSVTLEIARRSICFTGDPNDSYFQNLPGFFHDLPNIESFVRRNIPGDAVCLDVGANIGLTAILLSLLCPDGHVYAFEALPKNAEFLKNNIEINAIKNCTVIVSAVGAEAGVIEFTDSGAGSHAVTDSHLDRENRATVSVPIATLDSIVLNDLNLPRVDFIKIDIEGFEPPALSGAKRLIEKFRPPILMEFNSWSLSFAQGFSPFSFAKQIYENFDVGLLEPDGLTKDLNGEGPNAFLYKNMVLQGCVSDILLCLKRGAVMPSLADMTEYTETKSRHEAACRDKSLADQNDSRVAMAEARAAQADAQLASLYASKTWKLFAPYRKMRSMIRRKRMD